MELIITHEDNQGGPFTCLKRFWKFVKLPKTDHQEVAPLKVDGKMVTEPKQKAEVLSAQFQSVFMRETPFRKKQPHKKFRAMSKINITEPGVRKLLKSLNPGK